MLAIYCEFNIPGPGDSEEEYTHAKTKLQIGMHSWIPGSW